ncbi:X-ray radiation resistance-associated protein 1 isoform X5 [Pongo abelii]|uniref:X-ray radiation resistance-associated protein 1 isoform X5 n=2 Tax=Pongo abelii TaxID=9601 RepID=UPI0004F49494|nr:X-ray radiation resistance-associated protein 1 isoform X5 [Pongo abelii]XP_054297736.1 X-ray radiation resistance-associated protein 1 isoform X3 [Pongo pygmaeus]XP_054380793.1 X-ray radiation resistance-associated protein 1 isoform X5 [Pongo abelii]
MAFSGIYKLDDGKPYLNNCFPARNLLRMPEEGQGHWLVVQKGNLKKKPKGLVGAQAERQESLKATSFEFKGKKGSRRENQVDLPGRILDQAFLLKHHCVRKPSDLCTINVSGLKFSKAKENDFKHFHSVIYINASENLLPLEAFHTFPALKELDLAFNGIKTIYVKYGDFKLLEFLDLSFNSLTVEAICDLGILPHLRVLLLTGNGLTSLPPNLAVAEQEASVTSLTSKRYILRFPALETLMLDDNRLSNPSCFASLAGLRRLKKLSLDENRIIRIPYLQQVQLYDESVDWNGGRGSPQKEPQFILQSKPRMLEDSDEQLDYTVLPMKKDVDRTGVPPLLKSFLQERLGIHLIRRKIVKPKHHVLMSRKESRKVKTEIPKVPKQPLVLHHPRVTTTKSPSKDMLEPEAELAEDLPTTKSTSVESEMPTESLEGLSLSRRTFVPLPPICSDSTVHSEETLSHLSDTAVRLSPERPSDEDSKSTESIFLTQVNELPSSIIHKDDLELKEKDQKKPPTAPREVKGTRRKLPTASLPSKYHGYEELLTAKPDPAFIEPKGIQKNAQALQKMLKHPLLCHSSKPKLDTLQKPYVPKEKRAQRILIPPPRKTRAQLLDDIFIRLRDPRNITEAPLGAVLHQWTERRLVNHKQYLEAKRLLKEFQARYRQLVSGSLRTVFRTTSLPPACPALSESQPKFGHFLEFMDEFCQEPTASDSQG